MDLTVVLDHKFHIEPDGSVYAKTMFGLGFWSRYLAVFDRVNVIARLKPIDQHDESMMRTDNEQVSFSGPMYYEGPEQFIKNYFSIRRDVLKNINQREAVIIRLPQNLPILVGRYLARQKYPFAVELVGDPWDVLSPGASRNILRPIYRNLTTRFTRQLCNQAAAASYVTDQALQRRYPPGKERFNTNISSIELYDIVDSPRTLASFKKPRYRVITVGSFNQLYKGQDTLIEAFAKMTKRGVDAELVLVGDGKHRKTLETIAADNGVSQHVRFTGNLTMGAAVYNELDQADLFVLASRQEGLPRAMIEAMSRGLPCVGTDVGGIHELIPANALSPPNDPETLAATMEKMLQSAERMEAESAKNLDRAADFLHDKLSIRRREFYTEVKTLTAKHHSQ